MEYRRINAKDQSLAEQAYLAYGSLTDYKNFRGEPMPEFKDLPEQIKEAWQAAVNQITYVVTQPKGTAFRS